MPPLDLHPQHGQAPLPLWQQAVRSAQGRIQLYPRAVEGVDRLSEYKSEVSKIIDAVYDDAKAIRSATKTSTLKWSMM